MGVVDQTDGLGEVRLSAKGEGKKGTMGSTRSRTVPSKWERGDEQKDAESQ